MPQRIDIRLTLTGELAERLSDYLHKQWNNQRGSAALIARRAIREFLDRAEREELPKKD